jgi:copper chaperone CopZ
MNMSIRFPALKTFFFATMTSLSCAYAVAADSPVAPSASSTKPATSASTTTPKAASPSTVTLSGVHFCCGVCVAEVDALASKINGVKSKSDLATHTTALTAPDKATLQKAVDAIVAAGYFGTSSDPVIKVTNVTGAKDGKVQTLNVESMKMCCGLCTSAVSATLLKVPGVKSLNPAPGASAYTVTGDFNPTDVLTALNKAGISGKVAPAK